MLATVMKPVGGPHQVGQTVDTAGWKNRVALIRSGHIKPLDKETATAHAGEQIAELMVRVEAAEALGEQQGKSIVDMTARLEAAEDKLAALGDAQAQAAVAARGKGKGNA